MVALDYSLSHPLFSYNDTMTASIRRKGASSASLARPYCMDCWETKAVACGSGFTPVHVGSLDEVGCGLIEDDQWAIKKLSLKRNDVLILLWWFLYYICCANDCCNVCALIWKPVRDAAGSVC